MNRSNQFVFVPFCALAQAFHAKGLVKTEWSGSITPIMQLLIERGVNIIQMPCLETAHEGLSRAPQGRKHYNTHAFVGRCNKAALEVGRNVKAILKETGGSVLILGMEHSPTCAVDVQYPRKRSEATGFFIAELKRRLKDFDVAFIGINKRGIGPTLERIKAALDEPSLLQDRDNG